MYNPALMNCAGRQQEEADRRARETPTSAFVNGNQSPGMLAAVKAADLAVAKALANGPVAMVSA